MHTCIRGCFACEHASLSSIQVLSTLTLQAHEHVDINNFLSQSHIKPIPAQILCEARSVREVCHVRWTWEPESAKMLPSNQF